MIALAIVLGMSGLAQGQPTGVYINQTGLDNDGIGHQDNVNNLIEVDQISGNDPGWWIFPGDRNRAWVVQLDVGSEDNTMDIDQTGDGSNRATALQEGDRNSMDIDQVASGSDNTVGISAFWGLIRKPVLQYGDDNQMIIDQDATGDNLFLAEQFGNGNQMNVHQLAAGGDNKAGKAGFLYYEPLLQEGDLNIMTTWQRAGGTNSLTAEQLGNENEMDVRQFARTGDNVAGDDPLLQDGDDNYMKINQSTPGGDNLALAEQRGNNNEMDIKQDTVRGDNSVGGREWHGGWCWGHWDENPVLQDGNCNKIVGASTGGSILTTKIDYKSPATQLSTNGDNTLLAQQLGNCNKVGLYQEALGDNVADILQDGNCNYLAVWQRHLGGSNSLEATQIGDGNSATVWQDTLTGDGIAIVNQGP